jgi:hypothetical protein
MSVDKTWSATATEERDLVLNADGTAGTASIRIDRIFWSPRNADPACIDSAEETGIPLDTNVARCRRLCGKIPSTHMLDQTDPKRIVTGSTDHSDTSKAFSPEVFPDDNKACIHFKNWSSYYNATGTIVVPVKKR